MAERPDVGPLVNERVDYWSPFSGGPYDAVITAVNPDGTVAVAVHLPSAISRGKGRGLDEPIVKLRAASYGPQGRARPRG